MILTDTVEVPWLTRKRDFPEIAGSEEGTALVVGSGRCVWDDLGAARSVTMVGWDHVICVNDVGMHYPYYVNHWYSNDIQMLPKWMEARRPRHKIDFESDIQVHSCCDGVKWKWPWPGHGSSSLNAVFTALGLGYEKVILCGVPLDDSGHYFDPPWVKTNFARDATVRHWKLLAPKFEGRVRSMSGNSREILGGPS